MFNYSQVLLLDGKSTEEKVSDQDVENKDVLSGNRIWKERISIHDHLEYLFC